MGELYFRTSGRKIVGTIYVIISLCLSIFSFYWLFDVYEKSSLGWSIFLGLLGLLALWYAYDRFVGVIKNEICFYEKGMSIKKGFGEHIILLSEIKHVGMKETNGDNYLLEFVFLLNNDEEITIDSDDYANFPDLMKEYGKKFGLDWSFR